MKRYWLFEASQYYPSGGMLDWIGDYDTIEEAREGRTSKFDPNMTIVNYPQEWIEVQKTLPAVMIEETRSKYRKLDREQSEELEKMRVSYHIVDTQEKVIVEGWDGSEIIERTPLTKFK